MAYLLQVRSLMRWHHCLAASASHLEGLPSSVWLPVEIRPCDHTRRVHVPLPTTLCQHQSYLTEVYLSQRSKFPTRFMKVSGWRRALHPQRRGSKLVLRTGIRESLRERDTGNPVHGNYF